MDLSIATELCMAFEGFRARPYLCPAGIPTIGYGSTRYADGRRVTLQDDQISEVQAREMLAAEQASVAAPAVLRLCPGLLSLALRQGDWGKLNAIVDFVYNLGAGRLQTSTLRRKINASDWDGAKAELMRWVRGGGRVLPGLVLRRKAENALL